MPQNVIRTYPHSFDALSRGDAPKYPNKPYTALN